VQPPLLPPLSLDFSCFSFSPRSSFNGVPLPHSTSSSFFGRSPPFVSALCPTVDLRSGSLYVRYVAIRSSIAPTRLDTGLPRPPNSPLLPPLSSSDHHVPKCVRRADVKSSIASLPRLQLLLSGFYTVFLFLFLPIFVSSLCFATFFIFCCLFVL
jgi:hypothetical protein